MNLLHQKVLPVDYHSYVIGDWFNDHFVLAYEILDQGIQVARLDLDGWQVLFSKDDFFMHTRMTEKTPPRLISEKQVVYPFYGKTDGLLFLGEKGELLASPPISGLISGFYPLQGGSFIVYERNGMMESFDAEGKLLWSRQEYKRDQIMESFDGEGHLVWSRHIENIQYRLQNIFCIHGLAVAVYMDIDDKLHPLIRCFDCAGNCVSERRITFMQIAAMDLQFIDHPELGLLLCGNTVPENKPMSAMFFECFSIGPQDSIEKIFSVNYSGIPEFPYIEKGILYFKDGYHWDILKVADIKTNSIKKLYDSNSEIKLKSFSLVIPMDDGRTIIVDNKDRQEKSTLIVIDTEGRVMGQMRFLYQIENIVFSKDQTYACIISSCTDKPSITVSICKF